MRNVGVDSIKELKYRSEKIEDMPKEELLDVIVYLLGENAILKGEVLKLQMASIGR